MINFQDLYESYASEVYRFSLWMAGDQAEAEDITSDTFIRAWVHNDKIRTETLKAFLFTISRNLYLERLRKRKNQVVLNDVYPDPTPGPDKMTESQSILKEVKKILQTVPEIDRAAFVMRVQHELPYDEIARALKSSLTAVKVKVHRIRKKLIAKCIDKEVF